MIPHLLTWADADESRWNSHLTRAIDFARGKADAVGVRGKKIALLFMNPSLRTRTSMEVAAAELGCHVTTLAGGDAWKWSWSHGVMDGDSPEHAQDALRVLSAYYDALGIRSFDATYSGGEPKVDAAARYATVPVVNLESSRFHPCQALADATTLTARFGDPQGKLLTLAWTYHPRALPSAVPNSTLLMAARLGMRVRVAHPPGFDLAPGIMEAASRLAQVRGNHVEVYNDLDAGIDGTDVVYAKSWTPTDHDVTGLDREKYREWRITADRMAASADAAFMHCLPIRRNVVADDAVIDGPNSLIVQQAATRVAANKSILTHLWDSP